MRSSWAHAASHSPAECGAVCAKPPKRQDAQAGFQATAFTTHTQLSRIRLRGSARSLGCVGGRWPRCVWRLCMYAAGSLWSGRNIWAAASSSAPSHTQGSAQAMWQLGFNSRSRWSGANLVP